MKKFTSLFIVLSMLFSACPPVLGAEEGLIVVKDYASFENKQEFTSHNRKVEYTTDCVRSGDKALRVVANEKNNAALMYFPVDGLKAKTDYCLELYATTEFDIASLRLDLAYTRTGSSSGTYTRLSNAEKSIPIGSWGRFIVNFSINEESIDEASLALNVYGEYDTYIDDMVLYEGKGVTEDRTLINTPFESISPSVDNVMKTLYVDCASAPGGDGSETSPFSNIEEAKTYIRTINSSMTGNIVVYVKGGFYEVGETIEFETADSGTNGYYIIYKPYGDDKVTLSGGERVTGWIESEIPGVYKAPLENDYIRNLYVNDKRAKRATYNEFVTPIDWWDNTESSVSKKDGFVIPNGIIKNHEKAKHLEIYKTIAFRNSWAVGGEAVDNGDTTIIKMPQPTFKLHEIANFETINWDITDDFRLENALEFLDEPGEWYQDVDTDTLYYKPRNGESIEECEIVAPRVEHVINFVGDTLENRVENIIIQGFTIAHGAYGRTTRLGRANIQSTCDYTISATSLSQTNTTNIPGNINIYNARNISLRGNTVKHMSAVGVRIGQGADNCEVDGNAIYDTSSCALTVGDSNQPYSTDIESVPLNIRVTNNLIYHVAVEYDADPGIQTYYVNGVEIAGNEISDTPYSAICIGWDWNYASNNKQRTVVTHNRIYNYGTHCTDGGAVYSLGSQPGSLIADNYIIIWEQNMPGIYHDSGSQGFTDTRNVIRTLEGTFDDWTHTRVMDHPDTVVTGNYTSQPDFATQSDIIGNSYGYREVFSADAMEIIKSSGLQNEYMGLRKKINTYSTRDNTRALHIFTKEKEEQNPASIKTGGTLNLYTLCERFNGDMSVLDNEALTYSVGDPNVLKLEGSKISAIASGISTVMVNDSEGNQAIMVVTVDDAPEKIDVYTSKTSSPKDKLLSVTYRLKTKYWEYVGRPTYEMMSSSDDSVVEIVADGQLRTKNVGSAELCIKGTIEGYPIETTTNISVYEKGYRVFDNITAAGALKLDDIKNSFKASTDETVTEADFVRVLSGYADLKASDLPSASADTILTREKMLSYIAQVLIRAFGACRSGNYELPQFKDREEVTPSLIPDVALAYQYHMFIVEREPILLEPQREVTMQEASEFMFRFFRLDKCISILRDEGDFSKYNYEDVLMIQPRAKNTRSRSHQWALESYGEEKVDMEVNPYQGTLAYKVNDDEMVYEITKTEMRATAILNNVDFKSGKSYKVSLSARMQPDGENSVTNILYARPRIHASESTSLGWSGEIPISSDKWTQVSFTITIPENEQVEFQQIFVNVANAKKDGIFPDNKTDYVFELKDISVMEMPSFTSSVAPGEDNAMYPMDEIYLSFPHPVDETVLSADNFTVSGGAEVTSAELYNDNTVCVYLSGVSEDSEYTLSVNELGLQSGDVVTDTITWHTALEKHSYQKNGIWNFEASKTGVTPADETTGTRSTDRAKSGDYSFKFTSPAGSKLYFNTRYIGFDTLEPGKSYEISFWLYTETEGEWVDMYKHLSSTPIFINEKNLPANQWVKCRGIVNIPADDTADPGDLLILRTRTSKGGTCYIDDIEVKEFNPKEILVYRPSFFADGNASPGVTEGSLDVRIKTKSLLSGDTDVGFYLAQYDESGNMLGITKQIATLSAGESESFTLSLKDAKNVKTKIFVWDPVTLKPFIEEIQ